MLVYQRVAKFSGIGICVILHPAARLLQSRQDQDVGRFGIAQVSGITLW